MLINKGGDKLRIKGIFLLSCLFIFLFLSDNAFSAQYQTIVKCYEGVTEVKQQDKTVILTRNTMADATPQGITQARLVDIIPEEAKDLIKESEKERSLETRVTNAQNLQLKRKLVEDFIRAVLKSDFASLDKILDKDFRDFRGYSKYSYIESVRLWQRAMRTSGARPEINIISCVPSGTDSVKIDTEQEFYFGQKQFRYSPSTTRTAPISISMQISPDNKILRIYGAIFPSTLPDVMTQNMILPAGCYYNGFYQSQPITLNVNTASLGGQAVYITGSARLNTLTQSFDIDATVATGQATVFAGINRGDFYEIGGAGFLEVINNAVFHNGALTPSDSDAATLGFQGPGGIPLVTAVGSRYLFRSRGGRLCTILITQISAGNFITYNFVINPIVDDNKIPR